MARTHRSLTELTDEELAEGAAKGRRAVLGALALLVVGLVAGLWVDWRLAVTALLVFGPLLALVGFGLDAVLEESDRRGSR